MEHKMEGKKFEKYSEKVVIYQELDECLAQKDKMVSYPGDHTEQKRYFSPERSLRNVQDQSKPPPPSEEEDIMHTVIELEGKGVGIVALRDLRPGELLLDETPLILVPITEEGDLLGTWVEGEFHCHQLERELARIGERGRREFHKLQDSHSHTITGIEAATREGSLVAASLVGSSKAAESIVAVESTPPSKSTSACLPASEYSEVTLKESVSAIENSTPIFSQSTPPFKESEPAIEESSPASENSKTSMDESAPVLEDSESAVVFENSESALKDLAPSTNILPTTLLSDTLNVGSKPIELKLDVPRICNGTETNLSDLAQIDCRTDETKTSYFVKSSNNECEKTESSLLDDIKDIHEDVTKSLPVTCRKQPKTNYGILKTNSITVNSKNQTFLGLFLRISRLNHSCQPNCHHYWSKRTGKMAVRIVKKVKRGEEITISYMSPLTRDNFHDRSSRRAVLSREFGFCCGCVACAAPGDRRQEEARRLIREVESKWSGLGGDPAQAVKLSRQQLDAMTRLNYQVGLLSYSTLHCLEAISLFMHKTKVESVALQREGLGYARRGLSYSKIAYGADSEETAIFQRLASVWENSCDSTALLSNVQTCILALREIDV